MQIIQTNPKESDSCLLKFSNFGFNKQLQAGDILRLEYNYNFIQTANSFPVIPYISITSGMVNDQCGVKLECLVTTTTPAATQTTPAVTATGTITGNVTTNTTLKPISPTSPASQPLGGTCKECFKLGNAHIGGENGVIEFKVTSATRFWELKVS